MTTALNVIEQKKIVGNSDFPTRDNAEIDINQVSASKPPVPFGYNPSTTTALTFGYYGGEMLVDGVLTNIANSTLLLTASVTNYVEATRAGVVSGNSTAFTAGLTPLFEITTDTVSITNINDRRIGIPSVGLLSLSVAGGVGDTTLTAAQTRNNILQFTGALTGNRNIIVPVSPQSWGVFNDTTGAFTLTVKTAAGTGVLVTQGASASVYCVGVNVVSDNVAGSATQEFSASTFTGAGTGLTGTAAGLTAGNVTTNANLTGMVTSVGNATTVVTNANLTGGVTSVGNAATVITNANLTGVITSSGNATSVADSALSIAKTSGLQTALDLKAPLASPTFTGTVTVPTPSNATDASTKGYVDAIKQALDIKDSVRVASTANIAVASALIDLSVIDGVTVATGNRVLLKNQAATAENGIWVVVASGAASRSTDADISTEVTTGLYTFVSEGTASAGTGFVLTTADPITLGATGLTFTAFSGAGQVIAGNGLSESGNTLSINTAITADLSTAQTFTNKSISGGQITSAVANATLADKVNALNSATTVVNVSSAAAPTVGQILMATSGTAATWQTPAAGGVTTVGFGTTGLTPSAATGGAITVAGTLATANGGTGVTASTGSGNNVLSTSPTLVTPVLGLAAATSLAVSGFVGTAATGALTLPVGTTAQRPTPATGMTRFNSTAGGVEVYNGTAWAFSNAAPLLSLDYLVVAGGGGGAAIAGGGGAGGLLASTTILALGSAYVIAIGAGGAGNGSNTVSGANGGNSSIVGTGVSITSLGGGGGGRVTPVTQGSVGGSSGGSGGSDSGTQTPATAGTAGQGNAGGASCSNGAGGGGGGGKGAAGANGSTSGRVAGAGGTGAASSITGVSVTYAGGGGGGANQSTGGAGGAGGGGLGNGNGGNGGAGTVNLGGGGGGSGSSNGINYGIGGSGGSGVVIFKYQDSLTITIGVGLTGSTSAASGGFKVTTITAGTGNVSWA